MVPLKYGGKSLSDTAGEQLSFLTRGEFCCCLWVGFLISLGNVVFSCQMTGSSVQDKVKLCARKSSFSGAVARDPALFTEEKNVLVIASS